MFVEDWGKGYTTNRGWFTSRLRNENFNPDWAVRYAYDDDSKFNTCCHNDPHKYSVLYVSDDGKALIAQKSAPYSDSKVYLIRVSALKPEVIQVTMKDIEKKFGSRIEIVDEKEDE